MDGNGSCRIDEFVRNLQLLAFLTRHYIEAKFVDDVTDKPVSFVHMNLLRILDEHPGRTVGDIARFMNVSYPASTKTIDKLVRLGLLRRREDANDRRIAHLHLTSTGKKLVEKYAQLKREQIEQVINSFGQERAVALGQQMRLFARHVVDSIPVRAGICLHCGAFDPKDCYTTESEKKCGYLESVSEPGT